MTALEYISIFVKGSTFGATVTLGVLLLSYINVGKKSRWQKHLLAMTGIAMLTHALTLIYRMITDIQGVSDEVYFSTGAIMLDMICIAPLAIIEMMLTRHTILSPKLILMVYSPFIIISALHFATGYELIKPIGMGVAIFAAVCWTIMTSYDMKRYNTVLKQTYSDFEGRELHWLVNILILLVVALLIWSLSTIIGTMIAKTIYRVFIVAIWISLCRRVVLQKESKEIGDLSSNVSVFKKNQNNEVGPVDPEVFLIGQRLEELMRTKRLYTQFDVNTNHVVSELNCSKTMLSQYFASKGTTFHAYINELRLKCAVNLLIESREAVIDIASKSGFGFYNNFSDAFVRKFNCTPQDYRDKYRTNNRNN